MHMLAHCIAKHSQMLPRLSAGIGWLLGAVNKYWVPNVLRLCKPALSAPVHGQDAYAHDVHEPQCQHAALHAFHPSAPSCGLT